MKQNIYLIRIHILFRFNSKFDLCFQKNLPSLSKTVFWLSSLSVWIIQESTQISGNNSIWIKWSMTNDTDTYLAKLRTFFIVIIWFWPVFVAHFFLPFLSKKTRIQSTFYFITFLNVTPAYSPWLLLLLDENTNCTNVHQKDASCIKT